MIMLNTVNVSGTPGFRADLSTGTLASLAASGTATLVFDLAAQDGSTAWKQMCSVLLGISGGTASSGSSIKCYWSDDGSATDQVPAVPCYNAAGGAVNYTGGLDVAGMQLMVMKRYLRVVIVNGSTPQGAGAKLWASFLNV
jgi:hypothetical protein